MKGYSFRYLQVYFGAVKFDLIKKVNLNFNTASAQISGPRVACCTAYVRRLNSLPDLKVGGIV